MQRVSIISRHRRGQIWIQKSLLSLYMTEHRPTEAYRSRSKHGAELLPPYSTFLNIEQGISCLKAAIKADFSRPEIQRRMDDRDEARVRGIPLGEFRTQQLHEALHRNIDTITAAKSAQWYRFMETYLPKCLNREFIEG